jgi:hypothetical protein
MPVLPFRHTTFPPDKLSMMYRVLDECTATLVDGDSVDPSTREDIRRQIKEIILRAVADGEQEPDVLKRIVLRDFYLEKNG